MVYLTLSTSLLLSNDNKLICKDKYIHVGIV